MKEKRMRYVVATGGVSQFSNQAVHSLEKAVEDELKNGARLVGGVSVIYVPGAGYQAYQSVVHQESGSGGN
ncbi:hypothetical protein ACJJWD_13100 [Comamonas testosteroni]|uniref:hypothetical protein n=1 Tax=Comamonas testosteroni TaxID=285 RepID=UPI00389998FF